MCVVSADGSGAPEGAVRVTLLGVRVAVVPHLIIPGLDVESGGAVSEGTGVCSGERDF